MQKNITWDELQPGDYICYQCNMEVRTPRDSEDVGSRMEMFTHWLDPDRKLIAGVINSFNPKKCWLLKSTFANIIFGAEDEMAIHFPGEPPAPQEFLGGVQIVRGDEYHTAVLTDVEVAKIIAGRKESAELYSRRGTKEDMLARMKIADRIRTLKEDDNIPDEMLLAEYELIKLAAAENQFAFSKVYGSRLRKILDLSPYLSIPYLGSGLIDKESYERLGDR